MTIIPVIAAAAVVHARSNRREAELRAQLASATVGTPAYIGPVGPAPPSTAGMPMYNGPTYPQGAYPGPCPGYAQGTPVVGVPVTMHPVYANMSGRDLRRLHKQERREERRENRAERRELRAESKAQRRAIRNGTFVQPQTIFVQSSSPSPVPFGSPVRRAPPSTTFAFTEHEDSEGFIVVNEGLPPPPPVAPSYVPGPAVPTYDPYYQATAPLAVPVKTL